MNDNQNKPKQESPKTTMGGASAANSTNGWKKLLSKRWVTPAAFMVAAAIIVTLMWVYQDSDNSKPTTVDPTNVSDDSTSGDQAKGGSSDTAPVITGDESMAWPVLNRDKLEVALGFYDNNANEEERAAATIQSGDTFTPHVGIDLADPKGATFDVTAALSGKVTEVTQHPLNGNVVAIDSGNGLVTLYESLSNVKVAVGDEVKQGTVIAQAGRSDLEKDLGVHLHFEVRNNGTAVNPAELIEKK
ncbi:M23 family metallopeptidase [Paenibacillus protaetiae]|uniref:M23 family metallopeptidase n=1 Tax=Paenibacillus protaetiae TaxID=2509456 RepID=A0A4P6EYD4_9BACL|nr:M23 family metallopeptidase [Paenibacillus protaetiae]QAY67725.1 M23 family metallopeptidase [Paenibacillus protaetiae]